MVLFIPLLKVNKIKGDKYMSNFFEHKTEKNKFIIFSIFYCRPNFSENSDNN